MKMDLKKMYYFDLIDGKERKLSDFQEVAADKILDFIKEKYV